MFQLLYHLSLHNQISFLRLNYVPVDSDAATQSQLNILLQSEKIFVHTGLTNPIVNPQVFGKCLFPCCKISYTLRALMRHISYSGRIHDITQMIWKRKRQEEKEMMEKVTCWFGTLSGRTDPNTLIDFRALTGTWEKWCCTFWDMTSGWVCVLRLTAHLHAVRPSSIQRLRPAMTNLNLTT